MEVDDVYDLRVKLEDTFIDIKLWNPQKKELKKEVKGIKDLVKALLKLTRLFENRLDGFGPSDKMAPVSEEAAMQYMDDLEDPIRFCFKKFEKIRKLVEQEERMQELRKG